ncbi:extracellular catalytic domain type 1 short-chain-length polyhydroxyalkanoate depolymerase [Nocardia stercoris]|uniref:Esterase n=1 Tax=Nocardia stercoris TaxID=2483361 RepID=A0A3M2KXA8_9NOCA|nr:PHB depolymerase family esterase [Nocardia stercoris]RMI29694.1 esterase [Nocardia stercoris]
MRSRSVRTAVSVAAAAILLTGVAGCAKTARADSITIEVPVGDRTREALVHHPANAPDGPLPVVLIFHGGGGTPQDMEQHTDFDRLSDRDGFLAVYPAGYERSWNDGRGGDTKAGAAGIDDIGFVRALIDRLVATEGADPARVFATGISNGAMFTEAIGCSPELRIAAIAPVAGPLPAADTAGCAPSYAIPVLAVHGTADPIVPFAGGPVRVTSGHFGGAGNSPVLSVDDTQRFWRDQDGCTADPEVRTLPDTAHDGTSVTVTTTSGCRDGSSVELYAVTGGGHTWPGGNQYLPALLVGKVSHQFDAAEVIWDFFRAGAGR